MMQKFWNEFVQFTGRNTNFKGTICFGDNIDDANAAAEAILNGRKTIMTYPENGYRVAMKGMPAAGELNIVVNWAGEPVCVIETCQVTKLRFSEIAENQRKAEYPDADNWSEIKEAECKRELEELGMEFNESIILVAEEISVIFAKQA